jgi:hypothetical protein
LVKNNFPFWDACGRAHCGVARRRHSGAMTPLHALHGIPPHTPKMGIYSQPSPKQPLVWQPRAQKTTPNFVVVTKVVRVLATVVVPVVVPVVVAEQVVVVAQVVAPVPNPKD